MFSVKPSNSLPVGVKSILRGTQLAFWGIPQEFIVNADVVKTPLIMVITFKKDDSSKASIKTSSIFNNRIEIDFINPHKIEPTATIGRRPIVQLDQSNSQLTFSAVILNPESGYVYFYYEFYEEELTTTSPQNSHKIGEGD